MCVVARADLVPLQFHESKGIKFHAQSKVEKIVTSESDSSLAGAVVITSSSGETVTLPADVVVMGVGAAPATEFLRSSKGFEQVVDRTGAVSVDELLRVKGIDNVFAIGTRWSIYMGDWSADIPTIAR